MLEVYFYLTLFSLCPVLCGRKSLGIKSEPSSRWRSLSQRREVKRMFGRKSLPSKSSDCSLSHWVAVMFYGGEDEVLWTSREREREKLEGTTHKKNKREAHIVIFVWWMFGVKDKRRVCSLQRMKSKSKRMKSIPSDRKENQRQQRQRGLRPSSYVLILVLKSMWFSLCRVIFSFMSVAEPKAVF